MALNGYGVKIDGKDSNPGTLNAWLENNQGYHCLSGDCNNLILDAPERLAAQTNRTMQFLGEKAKPSATDLVTKINEQKSILIAHVRNNHHFVLLTSVIDTNTYTINDPGFNTTTVTYPEISDIITYAITN